jgi:hypothetical protein
MQFCVDCGSREFKSCYTEWFPVPGGEGAPVTLRLCLSCGARFPDRSQLRSHLLTKLPPARERRAPV